MTTRLVFEQIILGRNITVEATIGLRAEHMPSLFLRVRLKKEIGGVLAESDGQINAQNT